MVRKTIEYEGEFKVKLKFTMTSSENVDDATVEEIVKIMHNDMAEEIKEGVNYHFDCDGVDNLEVTCERIGTTTNVIDNTSEPEKFVKN